MNMPPIVSPQEWEAARQALLVKEKELTRARDALAAERRRMPRMAVEKDYRFEGPDGPASLLDLFDGRRQLIVYRFFFEPGRGRLARERLPRLLLRRRPGRAPRPSERPRHHARVRLARAAARHRALEGADGLGDPVVHDHGRLRRRLRRRRVARHQRLRPRRRRGSSAPTSSTAAATRRWGARGATSTSPRSGARRSGRTRPRATRRRRPTSGGTSTTNMARQPRSRRARHDRHRDAAHRAHFPGARRGGVRRVDQRGGAPALVARRARLGDERGRGRPSRGRRSYAS